MCYEVAPCIVMGSIVWVNGSYECGLWPDISIFRNSLKTHLAPNDRVKADDGYVGEHPQCCKCPASLTNLEETEYMQQHVRNRQESINNCFKFWGCLVQKFWHEIPQHKDCFQCIAVAIQLAISGGRKLFNCLWITLESLIVASFLQADARQQCNILLFFIFCCNVLATVVKNPEIQMLLYAKASL